MPDVSVVLSKFQYPIVEKLRAEGIFGTEDADIIRRAFLRWCEEHGVEPKKEQSRSGPR
jgi:hypothetical protein